MYCGTPNQNFGLEGEPQPILQRPHAIFTARCTIVHSAVLLSHVVRPSVCLSVCLWRWWIRIT